MPNRNEVYKCTHCGNIVELVHDSGVNPVCCGQKMTELVPNTVEASGEKHIPVVEVKGSQVHVNVGSVNHPMVSEHFIEWVYVETENGGMRVDLKDKPEALFCVKNGKPVAVYEYCNLHGLWKTDVKEMSCESKKACSKNS